MAQYICRSQGRAREKIIRRYNRLRNMNSEIAMQLTARETWTALHGLVFGGVFLLLFSGAFFGIWTLKSGNLSADGMRRQLALLSTGLCTMTVLVWLTVLTGTYVSYPWYRAKPSPGADLSGYPKSLLIKDPRTAGWHEFGMEWKEHIAWLSPILITAVTVIVCANGRQLAENRPLRNAVLMLFVAAFFCGGIAGVLGALINKMAPVK